MVWAKMAKTGGGPKWSTRRRSIVESGTAGVKGRMVKASGKSVFFTRARSERVFLNRARSKSVFLTRGQGEREKGPEHVGRNHNIYIYIL